MKRPYLIILILGIIYAVFILLFVPFPGDTDAYYHFNASQRLASGEGLTDPYLWNYLYKPDSLPAPAYTYWMPLYTLLTAPLMTILGASFKVALLTTLISWFFFAFAAAYIIQYLGGTQRQQIMIGIVMYLPGVLTPEITTTDVTVLYAAIGVWSLILMGIGYQKKQLKWLVAASVLGAFAGLTRNDGSLLIALAVFFAFANSRSFKDRLCNALIVGGIAFIVLLPWYIRNYIVIEAPFSKGGLGTIFLRQYEEMFAVEPEMSVQQFLDWGLVNILESRWSVFQKNALEFVLIEGLFILMPFALYTWWHHRRDRFLAGFGSYAILLHVIMTLIFAFPGTQGALMHSAVALVPFWGAMGLLGLEQSARQLGERQNWQWLVKRVEKVGFAAVAFIVLYGLLALTRFQKEKRMDYETLSSIIEDDSRVMTMDPVEFYYFTGQTAIIIPADPLEVAQEVAVQYCIQYLVLTENVPDEYKSLNDDVSNAPVFLEWIAEFESDGTDGNVVVYEFIDIPQQCETENE